MGYRYERFPLKPSMMASLWIELLPNKSLSRCDIIKIIVSHHKNNGGLDGQQNVTNMFKHATKILRDKGYDLDNVCGFWKLNIVCEESDNDCCTSLPDDLCNVSNVGENNLEFSVDEIIGNGSEFVYLYYYDTYKQLSELQKMLYWPCKIGRTNYDPVQRILEQEKTCFPEYPHIALIIKCNDSRLLEQTIHNVMKLKSRWISDAPGVEWFVTSPDEIKNIYDQLICCDQKNADRC